MHAKLACLLLAAALVAAQEPAATPAAAAAADPTTVSLAPVLRPAFKRTAAGEYDVPESAPADYAGALTTALAKFAGVKDDAVSVTAGKPVVANKPGGKVVEGGVTCAGPNVCMPFDATIKASSEKAASKLRDTLATGKLDGLSDQLKKATAALATAGGAALPAARGFNLGSVDGVASKRSLDLASLSSASKKGLSKGAIAGIVVGSVLGALLLAGLIWALCCRGGPKAATPAAATTAGAKVGGTTAAAAPAAAAAAPKPAATTGSARTTGATTAAPTGTAATTTTAAAAAEAKPQSGLAKLASTLSGRKSSKTAEVVDKAVDAVDKAADKVVDAANRV